MIAKRLIVLILGGFALAGVDRARADVLTYTNDRQLKGIVEERSPDSPRVKFIGADGSFMVPRSRIKSIRKESLAEGYVHIGDEFRRRGNYESAIDQYRRAQEQDPTLKTANERIEQTREALEERSRLRRHDELQEVDDIGREVRRLVELEEFERAEQLLERASSLVPNREQVEELQDLVGDLYLAWARYHLDRFDKGSAEEKLDRALVAQPRNDAIIALLLTLWEGQPDKEDQVLRIFETALENRPEDTLLRRKVADLTYASDDIENSLYHYLNLYERSERKPWTELEGRVVENLQRLHQKKAAGRDYEKAIYYYNLLAEIIPEPDPFVVPYYRFRQRALEVAADDIPGRVELARFAEQTGLFPLALQTYRQILEKDENNAEARSGIARFALNVVQQAEASFDRGDYIHSKLLANRVILEYEDAEEALGRALQIKAKAAKEIARDRRASRERAMDYVARGDQYFAQASQFYRDFFSTQIVSNTFRSNPKADAVRFYQYAIDAYEDALKIDPSLELDTGSFVGPNLVEAKRKLKELTSVAPRTGFSQRGRTRVF